MPSMMLSPFVIRKKVADAGRWLSDRGLVAGTDGNISVRLEPDRILITPTGFSKGRLSPDDMVIVDSNGKKLQGGHEASSEMLMHLFVYKKRPDVTACVHAHPPHATAFAVAGISLVEDILPEVVLFVGGIPLTDYAPPGTDAVPRALEPHIENHNAFLLRNHGLLTLGRSLDEACQRHETVEHYAQIVHLARQLGSPNRLPSEDYERLQRMRRGLDKARNKNG